MNGTQLQDSVRKQAASSQRPCYTVYQRTVKQMAPLGIWVILILPFILSFCRRGYNTKQWYCVFM